MAIQHLSACSTCHRHVREGSTQCPFCDTPFKPLLRPKSPRAPQRWLLAGAVVLGTWVEASSCAAYGAPSESEPPECPEPDRIPYDGDVYATEDLTAITLEFEGPCESAVCQNDGPYCTHWTYRFVGESLASCTFRVTTSTGDTLNQTIQSKRVIKGCDSGWIEDVYFE